MFKKVLIILPYKVDTGAKEQQIDFIYHTYITKLVKFGVLPVLCPSGLSMDMIEQFYDDTHGVLLVGGSDIDPAMYGENHHPATKVINPVRDEIEKMVIQKALQDKKPILGVCRGMQIVNCVLGGSLCQHLPELGLEEEHFIHEKYYEDSPSYDQVALDRDQYIEVLEETLLADIVGSGKHLVRCAHHQSIESVAESLKINSVTDFGVIEGLEGAGQYLMLVQHHIETQNNEFANSIWKSFADSL